MALSKRFKKLAELVKEMTVSSDKKKLENTCTLTSEELSEHSINGCNVIESGNSMFVGDLDKYGCMCNVTQIYEL